MFLLQSEKMLRESFRPRDQRQLELPKGLKFPLVVRDYFAWSDPSSPRVFLIFAEPELNKPIGVIFGRESSASPATGAICEWCHSYGSTNQIGMLTLEVSSTRSVGIHLCLDLGCREKIETDTSLTPIAASRRTRHVVDSMSRFVRRLIL